MAVRFPEEDHEESSTSSKSDTLSGKALEKLRHDILYCHFQPGDKLRLHDLRKKYGIGMSPIREALSHLYAEGLVTNESRRGFRVAPVSISDLEDILDMRVRLGVMALERAIDRGDDEWESDIVAALYSLSLVPRITDEQPPRFNPEWEWRHQVFHESLIAACGSPRLLMFIKTLSEQAARYRRLAASYSSQPREDNREHKNLADAVLARDKEKAAQLLTAHLTKTVKLVLTQQED